MKNIPSKFQGYIMKKMKNWNKTWIGKKDDRR